MVNYAYVCFIDKPVDENMQCTLHNDESPVYRHCGAVVRMGMPILIDATECELVDGYVYYIAARLITTSGRKGCKVGIVKCLFNQVHLFAHRVGYVTKILHPEENAEKTRTIHARNKCHGLARIVFADNGKTKFNQVESNDDILGFKDGYQYRADSVRDKCGM